jgi:hypothetical protein
MRRYVITVNQERIRIGDPKAIHVHDRQQGARDPRQNVAGISIDGPSEVVYRPEGLQDGSRVWIETDGPIRYTRTT